MHELQLRCIIGIPIESEAVKMDLELLKKQVFEANMELSIAT